MTTLSQAANYYVNLFESLKVSLGIDTVFMYDQRLIPGGTCLCIEPDVKNNELANKASAMMLDEEIRLYFFVYAVKATDGNSNRALSDSIASAVESEVFLRPRAGGLAIWVIVNSVESGFIQKNNTPTAANRLTVTLTCRKVLASPLE